MFYGLYRVAETLRGLHTKVYTKYIPVVKLKITDLSIQCLSL